MVDEVALADIRYSSRHANNEYPFESVSYLIFALNGQVDAQQMARQRGWFGRCCADGADAKTTLAPKGASSIIHSSENSRLAVMGMPPLMPVVLRRPRVVMWSTMARRKVVRVMVGVTVVLMMLIIPTMSPVITIRVIRVVRVR